MTATYGTFMMQLLKDYVNHEEVNAKIEEMYLCTFLVPGQQKTCFSGVNMGTRLVDEFFAKSDSAACATRRDIAEKIVVTFLLLLLRADPQYQKK